MDATDAVYGLSGAEPLGDGPARRRHHLNPPGGGRSREGLEAPSETHRGLDLPGDSEGQQVALPDVLGLGDQRGDVVRLHVEVPAGEGVGGAGREGDGRPRGREVLGDRPADPAARPGHDRHLAAEGGGLWLRLPRRTRRSRPVLCARAVLPGMAARGRGRIVNVASAAGTAPRPHFSAYGLAKTALVRLTETLALEAAPHGVRVFALHPGRVLTPMNQGLLASPEFRRWYPGIVQRIEEGRFEWMAADPAARLVVTLASGAADALSGRYLDVETDDVAALVARAEDIRQRNLLTLRVSR